MASYTHPKRNQRETDTYEGIKMKCRRGGEKVENQLKTDKFAKGKIKMKRKTEKGRERGRG